MAKQGWVVVSLVLGGATAMTIFLTWLILTTTSPPIPTHEILPLMRWLLWLY